MDDSRERKRQWMHEKYPVRPRPSEVFAERLRVTRKDRHLSQTELARKMTDVGRPMSKPALLRIEKGAVPEEGGRGLSLDEALAFCAVLGAAPATMLSPPEDELVWLTEEDAVNGEALRNWLRFGAVFSPATTREKLREDIEQYVLGYAQAILDAHRGKDEAGVLDAMKGLARSAVKYSEELEKRGVADAS